MLTKVRFDRFTNCLSMQIKQITLTHYSMNAFNYRDNRTTYIKPDIFKKKLSRKIILRAARHDVMRGNFLLILQH